jgi:hypothetical protein
MEQFFIGIGTFLIYGYSLSLIAGILIFKKLNSYTITVLTMFLFEVFMTHIESPLYDYILTFDIHSGRTIWYLSWMLFNLVTITFIEFVHTRLGIYRGSLFRLIKFALLIFALIYVMEFIDRYFTKFDSAPFIFLLIKSSIQLGVVFSLLYRLVKPDLDNAIIPHAAHNRSVDWFQSLHNLPPLQRARELEKWEEFTKHLPTDKSLNFSSRFNNHRF